jgi:hypothetical protein
MMMMMMMMMMTIIVGNKGSEVTRLRVCRYMFASRQYQEEVHVRCSVQTRSLGPIHLFTKERRRVRLATHSPSVAEVKHMWYYTSTLPYTFRVRCFIKKKYRVEIFALMRCYAGEIDSYRRFGTTCRYDFQGSCSLLGLLNPWRWGRYVVL